MNVQGSVLADNYQIKDVAKTIKTIATGTKKWEGVKWFQEPSDCWHQPLGTNLNSSKLNRKEYD